jgi:hypothetical protein
MHPLGSTPASVSAQACEPGPVESTTKRVVLCFSSSTFSARMSSVRCDSLSAGLSQPRVVAIAGAVEHVGALRSRDDRGDGEQCEGDHVAPSKLG